MQIGTNEFDYRTLALLKQQRERPKIACVIKEKTLGCTALWDVPPSSRAYCKNIKFGIVSEKNGWLHCTFGCITLKTA